MTRLRKVASMFQIVDLMYPTEKESLLDRTLDERHKLLHMRVWIKSRKRINSPLLWTVPRMVTEPLWKNSSARPSRMATVSVNAVHRPTKALRCTKSHASTLSSFACLHCDLLFFWTSSLVGTSL